MGYFTTNTSADLVDSYDRRVRELFVSRLKTLCMFCAFVLPTGWLMDRFVYPDHVAQLLSTRVATAIIMLVLWLFMAKFHETCHPLVFTAVFFAVLYTYTSLLILFTDGVVSQYYAGFNLIMLGTSLFLPWRFTDCAVAAVASLIFYGVACWGNWILVGPPAVPWGPVLLTHSFIQVVNIALCLIATYYSAQFRFRDFELQYNLDQKKNELEISNRKLKDLDSAKNKFLANVSHELRTPLTLILAPIEKMRTLAAEQNSGDRSNLDIMFDNAMRLLSLINDLLDLVRLEDRKLQLKREPVDLRKVLPGLVAAVRGVSERNHLALRIRLPDDDSLVIDADRDKIEKIILNLLFNAIKFTPANGSIDVTAVRENESVTIQIEDTGVGISEENLGIVFDRFSQVGDDDARIRQGTGIGLSLVRELVELHGGEISVVSEVGVGTTFGVRFPSSSLEPAVAETVNGTDTTWLNTLHEQARRVQGNLLMAPEEIDYVQNRDPRKHTILIVENEPDMLRFLISEFENDYNLLVATDGQRAMELSEQGQPELILTDLTLPKMDGITLCRKLKSHPSVLPTKIVIMTARADDSTLMDALNAEADDFIKKPFGTVELKTRLRNILISAKLERELHKQNIELTSTLQRLKKTQSDLELKHRDLRNTLQQLQATEAQLIQAERLSALGQLSAGIMHEINNPVNFMMGAVNFLRMDLGEISDDNRETIDDIEDGLKRIRDIIDDLKGFAYGKPTDEKQECPFTRVMQTVKRLLANKLTEDVVLEVNFPYDLTVYANQNQLTQLVVNIIQNAVDATQNNAKLGRDRRILVTATEEPTKAVVTVRDNGEGIPEDKVKNIFDPFFTTKEVGKGMGLGLSICYTIIKQHNGNVKIDSEPGGYTAFIITMPKPGYDESAEDAESAMMEEGAVAVG